MGFFFHKCVPICVIIYGQPYMNTPIRAHLYVHTYMDVHIWASIYGLPYMRHKYPYTTTSFSIFFFNLVVHIWQCSKAAYGRIWIICMHILLVIFWHGTYMDVHIWTCPYMDTYMNHFSFAMKCISSVRFLRLYLYFALFDFFFTLGICVPWQMVQGSRLRWQRKEIWTSASHLCLRRDDRRV